MNKIRPRPAARGRASLPIFDSLVPLSDSLSSFSAQSCALDLTSASAVFVSGVLVRP